MNLDTQLLKEIVKNEKELGLYSYKVFGFSVWRIFRYLVRSKYLNTKTGFTHNTVKNPINYKELFFSYIKSTLLHIKILFSRNANLENIIYAFPRLQKIKDEYMDKFTDPVILNSELKKSYIVFQRNLTGTHKSPRFNTEKVVRTDFVDVTAKILAVIFLPIVSLIFGIKVFRLFKKANKFYNLSIKWYLAFLYTISVFIFNYFITYNLLKKIKPKKVFFVNRMTFFHVTLACKRLKIKTFEMQHGITHNETVLYSGDYDQQLDPDYFLVFGEAWVGHQFGMPIDKIINIGWAYKNMIKDMTGNIDNNEKNVLVISEPHISDKIIDATSKIAKKYSDYEFHIRLHPQESLLNSQLKEIDMYSNISIQDNTVESTLTIMSYNTLIGENSSVLYEALSYGKKVGRINFGGLVPEELEGGVIEGFYYLNSENDFKEFINSDNLESENVSKVYSEFKSEVVNAL